MKAKKFDLADRLLDYAAAMLRLSENLPNSPAGNHLRGQLLRAGPSPLVNHAEAEAAD
jgi:hypothetical protein